jgi:MSHA biogenesis protein MshM
MMYLDHFGLSQAPFRITPHTEFFFAGANRGATLEALIYAITHDEGIVKVSGEVGSGKTMLCRMLLEKLPKNVDTVYLANPLLSRGEILVAIADELQVSLPDERSHLWLRLLQERLLAIYAAGRQVVALIDEAHAMPPEALEEIRLLSNLESRQHKLLQIVLFGQPELDHRLSERAMRQLNDRITHHFGLEPMRASDVAVYLMFRLRAAGYHGPDLFTKRAVQLISRASEGLNRRINILADKALLAAFSDGVHQIAGRQARAAIRDVEFRRLKRRFGIGWAWAGAAAAGLCVVVVVAYLAGTRNLASLGGPAGVPLAEPPVVAAMAVAQGVEAPLAAPALALDATSGVATAELSVAAAEAPPPGTELPRAPASLTLAERSAASAAWLAKTPDSHFFIQLLVVDAASEKEVLDFIDKHAATLDLQQLRVYRSSLSGRDRLGVIYGDYPSRELANAALAKLAEVSPASKPYVRAVSRLR